MSPSPSAAAYAHHLQYYIQYASIVFVWYDFVLTFSLETKYIWGVKKFGWITVPFIFLRYALVANVLYLFAISHLLSDCDMWYKFIGVLSVLGRAAVITIFTRRTVAVYHKNRLVLAWLTFLGMTCVALDITHLPGLKCSGSVSIPIVPTLLSVLVCAFELSVVALIAARAIKVYYATGPGGYQKGGLLDCLLQQGLLYFCGVFGFQLTAVVLNFASTNPAFQKLINAITLPMSCVLAARFTLQLRALDAENKEATNASVPPLSSLNAAAPPRHSQTVVESEPSADYEDVSYLSRAGQPSPGHRHGARDGEESWTSQAQTDDTSTIRSATTYRPSLHTPEPWEREYEYQSDMKGKRKARVLGSEDMV